MRVLWFTNTSSLFREQQSGYNGGGWISSLESLIKNNTDIELGISFFGESNEGKVVRGQTTYYPISLYNSKLAKIKHNLKYESYDRIELEEYLRIISDFEPDVIHIFGSEKSFGLVSDRVSIPVVIHLQGILSPYLNAWYPPGASKFDYYKFLKPKELFNKLKTIRFFSHNAQREADILSKTNYFMGRTHWDKAISNFYSPNSTYFHCDEILRNKFYEADVWKQTPRERIEIVTTISKMDYKGFDLILKTANLLTSITKVKFQWKVFGVTEYKFWERKLKLKACNLNVLLCGVASEETIVKELQNADMYIHPSYIDNSPNSLCEAQMIGIPVVSTNVGGVSSLIENNVTGLLVPANDPWLLSHTIVSLFRDVELMKRLGIQGRAAALIRHDRFRILDCNINVYKKLLPQKEKQ